MTKTGNHVGWKVTGVRKHRGRTVTDVLGVFYSFIDADQAADEYHRKHPRTITVHIQKHYEERDDDGRT